MEQLIKLHEFMSMRMKALESDINRDKMGGLADSNAKYMECKFWKEYIEREFFNGKS
jgi:hypothetical protein